MSVPSTSVLAIAAGRAPLTILGREAEPERTFSHDELAADAEGRAVGLAERGLERGDVVALFAHATLDFVTGCFAAWRRGCAVVTLPLPPPLGSRAAWSERVNGILSASAASALLRGQADPPLDTNARVIDLSSLGDGGHLSEHGPSPEDVALIQFTSGSTADPKGIVLEHRAVVASIKGLTRRLEPGRHGEPLLFSWVPLHHDLGFVNYMLHCLTQGWPGALMPTQSFAADPMRWLTEMSNRKASAAAAPSSAYGLLARELENRPEISLDLSAWRCAGCGGEPIDPAALERFAAAAGRHGFDPAAYSAGWGLAEATCSVTLPGPESGLRVDRLERERFARGDAAPARSDDRVVSIVDVGWALDGYDVAITDQDGARLPDRRVGEIVVRGPSLMRGYLGDDAATAASFRDGWLVTGDLGYLVDGHLFVTGRIKDVIIVGGANYHASDLERIVEAVPGIRRGGSAAVSVRGNGSEKLAVVAESRLDTTATEAQKQAVRMAVLDETGISPALVLLVRPRTLPKTTSGKLRRAEVRRMLEEGELGGVEEAQPRRETTEIEESVAQIWRTVLGVSRVGLDDDFFELGGSSLQAAAVVAEIDARLGVRLPLSALATTPTLAKLAARVASGHEIPTGPLVRLREAEAGPDVFAIPGGAGGVLTFRRLANALDGACSFYAFDPKGADARSWPARSIEEMAEQYLAEMRRVSDGPYICIGYSFGGIVAYEMAVRLASEGATGTRVVMLDTAVPTRLRPPGFNADRRQSAVDLYWKARALVGRPVVHALAWTRINLRTPISPKTFSRYLLDNSRAVTRRYAPRPYAGPVDYVQVQIDDHVPSERHVDAWRTVASDLRTHRVSAPSHFHLLLDPWVDDLATHIRSLWI